MAHDAGRGRALDRSAHVAGSRALADRRGAAPSGTSALRRCREVGQVLQRRTPHGVGRLRCSACAAHGLLGRMADAAESLNLSNDWPSNDLLLRARQAALFARVGLTEFLSRAIELGIGDAAMNDEIETRSDERRRPFPALRYHKPTRRFWSSGNRAGTTGPAAPAARSRRLTTTRCAPPTRRAAPSCCVVLRLRPCERSMR